MAGERKLFDNLFKVVKANSGGMPDSQTEALTEILDLQIPRGYCARIRKVRFQGRSIRATNQQNVDFMIRSALVADPDDETSLFIPAFTVDHDVICDYMVDASVLTPAVQAGATHINQLLQEINFDETLDVVTVRNLRFNTIGYNFNEDQEFPQVDIEVYFTYEKISVDLYQKLLGIS